MYTLSVHASTMPCDVARHYVQLHAAVGQLPVTDCSVMDSYMAPRFSPAGIKRRRLTADMILFLRAVRRLRLKFEVRQCDHTD